MIKPFSPLGAVGICLIIAGALAGCTDEHALRCCTGQIFPLNTGHWQATPADLAAAQKMATTP